MPRKSYKTTAKDVEKPLTLPEESSVPATGVACADPPADSGESSLPVVGVPGSARRREITHARQAQVRDMRQSGQPLSTVKAGPADHRVWRLAPSPAWVLLVGHTENPAEPDVASRLKPQPGRSVGLLVPYGAPLHPLPEGFDPGDIADATVLDHHLQDLLNSPTGILGVRLSDQADSSGRPATESFAEVLHWVVRLLPLRGPCQLDVHVVSEGNTAPADGWEGLAVDIRQQLSEVDPARTEALSITIQPIASDWLPYAGYLGLVAQTWGSAFRTCKERLKRSGLSQGCLIEHGSRMMRLAWDGLAQYGALEGEQWRSLLREMHPIDPNGLAGTLMGRLLGKCLKNPALWRRYVEASYAHLESQAVNLHLLRREMEWLEVCKPPNERIKLAARFAFLTARLAEATQIGPTEKEWETEVMGKAGRFFEEDPSLVCLTDLYFASAAANRFDWEAAQKRVEPWLRFAPEVPGLQMWARTQSLKGQLLAMGGDPEAALAYFDRALAGFGRLSDPDIVRAEQSQTRPLRAMAGMDSPKRSAEDARSMVEAVIGPLADAVPRLAVASLGDHRSQHHLLLRYLVTRGTPAEQAAYLQLREDWTHEGETAHPYPLIQAYRAFLLHSVSDLAALDLLREAGELSLNGGSGLFPRLVAAVLGVIGHAWGEPWPEATVVLAELRRQFPLVLPSVKAMEAHLVSSGPPLDLLARALPFSLH